jgi:hypothetical protein
VTAPYHHHWHKFVTQCGQNLYYQCDCGSRSHGIAASAKRHVSVDHAWLAGEKDHPDDC